MSLRTKLMAGILAILVLLGLFGLTKVDFAKKEEIKQQEAQEKVLFEESSAAIKKYVVTDTEKTMEFVKQGVDWVIVGAEEADLLQLSIDQAIATLRTLSYTKVVENGMEKASDFGLTTGVTDEAYDENGNLIYKITVGNKTVDGTGYYVTVDENDPNVYIVAAGHGKVLSYKTEAFRDKYPAYVDYASLLYMNIDIPGVINYNIKPSEQQLITTGYGEYMITDYYSYDVPTITEQLSTKIGGPVYEITAVDFIDYPDETFDYGFDDPTVIISMEDEHGYRCKIVVGNKCSDDKYYAAFSDKPYYCTVRADKVESVLETKPFELIGKFFFNNAVSDIKEVTVSDGSFDGRIAFNEDKSKVYLNNSEITEEKFNELYQKLLEFTIDGEAIGEYGDLRAQMCITLNDSTAFDFKFYEYDDNFYAVERNGAVEFVTSHRNVEGIFNLLK